MPERPDIETPSRSLLTYYFLIALLTGPFVLIVFPISWIRFKTLRYELQPTGIRMSVGMLFRKEVIVAYRRIQDIHVSHDVIQRWLGISSVSLQTASGNAAPEIIIEGVRSPDTVRDWLYRQTRGAKSGAARSGLAGPPDVDDPRPGPPGGDTSEVTALLRGIRDDLACLVDHAAAATGSPRPDHAPGPYPQGSEPGRQR